MAWNHMPQPQQRGSQLGGNVPREAVADRSAQKNDEADQQVAGAPAEGPDYPASQMEARPGDITPTRRESSGQAWDEVVQPEQARPATDETRDADDGEPLPEGK